MSLRVLLDPNSQPYSFNDSVPEQTSEIATNLANGWTDVTTTWAPANVMADLLATKLQGFTDDYAAAIIADVTYTSKGGITKTYQSDQPSLGNLESALLGCQAANPSAPATPPGFYWQSSDNTQVPFTFADLQGLAALIWARGAAAYQVFQTKKAAARAASTYVELCSIV